MLLTAVVVLLSFMSVFLIVVSIPGIVSTGPIGEFRRRKLSEMEQWHKNLFVSGHSAAEQMAWLEWGSVIIFLVCALLLKNVLVGIIIVLFIWRIPPLVYWYYSKIRKEQFDEHLPVVLDQLTSATKAGKSLSQAITDVAKYAPHPISQELGQISNDQKLGIDLATALKSARERVGSKPFGLAVTAMLVNAELGGNLPNTMTVMSASLKEIWRLDQKLETSSAEGRKGAMILCLMPVVIFIMVLVMQPDLLNTLLSSAVGYVVLIVAVLCYLLGLYWMYRILQVDI